MMKRLPIVLIIIVMMVLSALPVLAIADPDSPPQVTSVYVYEDCLETGDVGVLVDIYIDYTDTGNETATEAYLVSFIDTDGTTQLSAVAPYVFVNSGYGRNAVWMRFTPAEVTTHGLSSANQALYEIWLAGNPTVESGWTGDPPKTIAGIDEWGLGITATTLSRRVLSLANELELVWSLDLLESTADGSKLTSIGEEYFSNVIPSLRLIAPVLFASGTVAPIYEELDYTTTFGATMTDGTGTVTGSPITFAEGDTVVDVTALGATGTFILELEKGTAGTVTDLGGTVTGSPVEIVAGENTIVVTVAGTLTVSVALETTQTAITATVIGTGLDLTDIAAEFGMSRMMFSGFVWIAITILICAGFYKGSKRAGAFGGGGGDKAVMVIFDICIIGGAVLGLLPVLVAVLMFIGFGLLTGYVLFYRQAHF